MQIRGVVRVAQLQEHPPGSDRIEMVLSVQGVGPSQPRRLVIPYEFLVREEGLEPESVVGRGFLAEVGQDAERRWVIHEWTLAPQSVLRPET